MVRRYPVILLLASIAVLALGSLARRRTAEPKAQPAPIDLEILQRLTADRRLRDLSSYLSEKARAAAGRLSASGLVWDASTVIAPSDGARPGFAPREETSTLRPVVPVRPRSGDWLLAVARDPAGDPVFAHGLFEGITRERCGTLEYDAVHFAAPLAASMIGGGVFLIDGGVAGFIGACNGRPVAIASSTIADALAHPPSHADRIEHAYGFRCDEAGLVTAVWQGSAAERAGLSPGDRVDPAGEPPATAQRGRRTIPLSWIDEEPLPSPPVPRGLSLDGAAVTAVAPGSPGADAGVLPGDLIVRVAGKAAPNPAPVLDRAKGPVTVTIDRNGRRRETLLQP